MARMKRATDEEVLGDGEFKIRVIRDIRGQSAFWSGRCSHEVTVDSVSLFADWLRAFPSVQAE